MPSIDISLTRIGELCTAADSDLETVKSDLLKLLAQVARHEAAESKILQGYLLDDFGVAD